MRKKEEKNSEKIFLRKRAVLLVFQIVRKKKKNRIKIKMTI